VDASAPLIRRFWNTILSISGSACSGGTAPSTTTSTSCHIGSSLSSRAVMDTSGATSVSTRLGFGGRANSSRSFII
jgi:hypothetical protein